MLENWSTWQEIWAAETPGPRRLERALRSGLRSGALAPGARLPSTRELASAAGVARGTVTAAYDALIAEGYLVARRGSGTSVAVDRGPPMSAPPGLDASNENQPQVGEQAVTPMVTDFDDHSWPRGSWPDVPGSSADRAIDLRPGVPALDKFPRREWIAAYRTALTALPTEWFAYPDPAGLPMLRRELAGYLGRVRGVLVDPAAVQITAGFSEGTSLVATALRRRGVQAVGVEGVGHPGAREHLRHSGFTVIPIHVDHRGIDPTDPAMQEVQAVLVTAAHQFPLGVVLDSGRRAALLQWVMQGQRFVIEDDYDAEHRYDRPPVGAIQPRDPQRILYLGSVSKTLAPALRLGWFVGPADIRREVTTEKYYRDLGRSSLDQAAFAGFLAAGTYDRHLRRMRRVYRTRRDALVAGLAPGVTRLAVSGISAGLHVTVPLPPWVNERRLAAQLAAQGVRVRTLADYRFDDNTAEPRGLVLGYAAEPPDRLREAAGRILTAVFDKRP